MPAGEAGTSCYFDERILTEIRVRVQYWKMAAGGDPQKEKLVQIEFSYRNDGTYPLIENE